MGVSWREAAFKMVLGIMEGIYASANLGMPVGRLLHIIPPNPAAASPRDGTRL